MKHDKRYPNSFLTRLASLLVAELFLCSSLLPAWALPTESLRPKVAAERLFAAEKETADGGEKWIPGLYYGHGRITSREIREAVASSRGREPLATYLPKTISFIQAYLKTHQASPYIPELSGLEERLIRDLTERTFVIQPRSRKGETPGVLIKKNASLFSFVEPSGDILIVEEVLEELIKRRFFGVLEPSLGHEVLTNYLISSVLLSYPDVDQRTFLRIRKRLSGETLSSILREAAEDYRMGGYKKPEYRGAHNVAIILGGMPKRTPQESAFQERVHAFLSPFALENRYGVVLLKGGSQGGLHPAVKEKVFSRLSPYFEIVEGTPHGLSHESVFARWHDEIWKRLLDRKGIQRLPAFQELRVQRRYLAHPKTFQRLRGKLQRESRKLPEQERALAQNDLRRLDFILKFLQAEALPLLLHRKVPREVVVEGLGIAPDRLTSLLQGKNLLELFEQDFVKHVVVEVIREELFSDLFRPTHPLHDFLQKARVAGLTDRGYFLTLLSPLHSPFLSHHNELFLETSHLPENDLVRFKQFIESRGQGSASDGGEGWVPGLLYGQESLTRDEIHQVVAASKVRSRFVDHYPDLTDLVGRFLKSHETAPTIPELKGLEGRLLRDLDRLFVIQPEDKHGKLPAILVKGDTSLFSYVEPSGDIFVVRELLDEMESNPDKLDPERMRKAKLNYLISSILFSYSDVASERIRAIQKGLSRNVMSAVLRRAVALHREGLSKATSMPAERPDPDQTMSQLLHEAAARDHALVLLKGGKWGGLRPTVKQRILELLDPFYDVTKGTTHLLPYYTIFGRWGKDFARRLVFRRMIQRELKPQDREYLRKLLSTDEPWPKWYPSKSHMIRQFLANLKMTRVTSSRAIEFQEDVKRFTFTLNYLDSSAQPLLLYRKVPREKVIQGLGITPEELSFYLGGRTLTVLTEQDFVKRVVVEAIRKRLFDEMKQPAHPLHGFLESAQASGLTDESYFLGLLSPIHSPFYALRGEFDREVSYLYWKDQFTFAQAIRVHRGQEPLHDEWHGARDGGHRDIPGILRGRGGPEAFTEEEVSRAVASSTMSQRLADYDPEIMGKVRAFLEEHRRTPTLPALAGLEERLMGDLETVLVIQPRVNDREIPGILVKKHDALFSVAAPGKNPLVVKKVLVEMGRYAKTVIRDPEKVRALQSAYLITTLLHRYEDIDAQTLKQIRKRLARKSLSHFFTQLVRQHHAPQSVAAVRNPYRLGPEGLAYLRAMSPEKHKEIEETSRLFRLLTKNDVYSLVLLKGGARGGLHPAVKERFMQRLHPSFEIVEGAVHPPSMNAIIARWGTDLLRRIYSREGLRQVFPRQLIRAMDRMLTHPFIQRAPAWAKRLVFASWRPPEDLDEMESFVQSLPNGHPMKAFWMQFFPAMAHLNFEALLRDPKFPLDASRKQFVEDYVDTEVQSLLLHRTVPREKVLENLGVSHDILDSLLRGRSLEEMKEQDFIKEIVVEAIRMEELARSADPAHPLHGFVEEAHAAGLVVDNYFLGLVSFVHSPRSGRELSWETAFLPREDLAPFVRYIERTSNASDRGRAGDGGRKKTPPRHTSETADREFRRGKDALARERVTEVIRQIETGKLTPQRAEEVLQRNPFSFFDVLSILRERLTQTTSSFDRIRLATLLLKMTGTRQSISTLLWQKQSEEGYRDILREDRKMALGMLHHAQRSKSPAVRQAAHEAVLWLAKQSSNRTGDGGEKSDGHQKPLSLIQIVRADKTDVQQKVKGLVEIEKAIEQREKRKKVTSYHIWDEVRFLEEARQSTGTPLEGKWNYFLIAEKGGRPIGYLMGILPSRDFPVSQRFPDKKVLYVLRLAVHPDFWGTDVWYKLGEKFISLAQKEGFNHLAAETEIGNKRAQRLYEKLGFNRAQERFDTTGKHLVEYEGSIEKIKETAKTLKPARDGGGKADLRLEGVGSYRQSVPARPSPVWMSP